MKKQSGQSAVEFALVAPFFIIFILMVFCGGIMFMDYLNFNNLAHRIAREVSVSDTWSERNNVIRKYAGFKNNAGIYNVSINVSYDNDNNPEDVTVRVDFERDKAYIIIPKELTINYTMRLENIAEDYKPNSEE